MNVRSLGTDRITDPSHGLHKLLLIPVRAAGRWLASASASYLALQQSRADERARAMMVQMMKYDPQLAADLRAALLRNKHGDDLRQQFPTANERHLPREAQTGSLNRQ